MRKSQSVYNQMCSLDEPAELCWCCSLQETASYRLHVSRVIQIHAENRLNSTLLHSKYIENFLTEIFENIAGNHALRDGKFYWNHWNQNRYGWACVSVDVFTWGMEATGGTPATEWGNKCMCFDRIIVIFSSHTSDAHSETNCCGNNKL